MRARPQACLNALLLLCAAAVALACGDPASPQEPPQPPAADKNVGPPEPPQEPPPPSGTLARELFDKAKKYVDTMVGTDMRFEDKLEQGGARDYLAVLKYPRCYRVVAVGGPQVEDLDLALFDPSGVLLQEDLAQDALPVLGLEADICPGVAGAYRLQVRMRRGEGPFLARIYQTGD